MVDQVSRKLVKPPNPPPELPPTATATVAKDAVVGQQTAAMDITVIIGSSGQGESVPGIEGAMETAAKEGVAAYVTCPLPSEDDSPQVSAPIVDKTPHDDFNLSCASEVLSYKVADGSDVNVWLAWVALPQVPQLVVGPSHPDLDQVKAAVLACTEGDSI